MDGESRSFAARICVHGGIAQCLNAKGYHVASYSLKLNGEQYETSSGCMLTVEESYESLIGGTSYIRHGTGTPLMPPHSPRTPRVAHHHATYRQVQSVRHPRRTLPPCQDCESARTTAYGTRLHIMFNPRPALAYIPARTVVPHTYIIAVYA